MSTGGEVSGVKKTARYNRDDLDFFTEPEWCVDALLDAEPFFGDIADPACGSCAIVRVAHRRGYTAGGWDIVHRGSQMQMGAARDFLQPWTSPRCPTNIICNPPFRHAEAFIRQALSIAQHKVAMLVQSKFLYSRRRHKLFSEHPPARIYFLSSRPSMPPGEMLLRGEIKASGGKLDYAWILWAKDHKGPTTTHWLLRPKEGANGSGQNKRKHLDGQKEEAQEKSGTNGSEQGAAPETRHDTAA